jgi:hypothetical protein
MTPIEYYRNVRIARARELLVGGDVSQKLIAESLGYKDVASFARVFHKAVGSAPGSYRIKFGRKGTSPADFAAIGGLEEASIRPGLHPGSPRHRHPPTGGIGMSAIARRVISLLRSNRISL